MNSAYLLINFFTVIIPLLFSFHPRIRFYKHWPAFFGAAMLTAIPFVIWDVLFTQAGVWSFNDEYVTGVTLLNLPLEEVLFFICIPFSCVFTYVCLSDLFSRPWTRLMQQIACVILSALLLFLAVLFADRLYTTITFASTALLCLYLVFVRRVHWFGTALSVYGILLVPFLIVNGLLTGTGFPEPVVLYNDAENLGIRVLTIPVEDVFYGFELFLLNLLLFHTFTRRPFAVRLL